MGLQERTSCNWPQTLQILRLVWRTRSHAIPLWSRQQLATVPDHQSINSQIHPVKRHTVMKHMKKWFFVTRASYVGWKDLLMTEMMTERFVFLVLLGSTGPTCRILAVSAFKRRDASQQDQSWRQGHPALCKASDPVLLAHNLGWQASICRELLGACPLAFHDPTCRWSQERIPCFP